jgi:hypothetical protein
MGQAAGESARHIVGNRRRSCGARGGFFELRFFSFGDRFYGRTERRNRLVAILCKGFAGKHDLVFNGIAWRGAVMRLGMALIKSALSRTAWFESARLRAARFETSRFATRFSALRRSIFRGRQVAPATGSSWRTASATTASAAAETPAAISAGSAIAALVTISATAKILAGAIVAAARRIIFRGIVMRSKILRRGSVGIRLALVRVRFVVHLLDVRLVLAGFVLGRGFLAVFARHMFVRLSFFVMRLIEANFLVMRSFEDGRSVRQCFAGK